MLDALDKIPSADVTEMIRAVGRRDAKRLIEQALLTKAAWMEPADFKIFIEKLTVIAEGDTLKWQENSNSNSALTSRHLQPV